MRFNRIKRKRSDEQMEKNVWAVGDIHGCIDHLEKAIEFLHLDNNEDIFIFLGDYVDRGKDPYAVVKRLQELQKKYGERIICLRGNHEQMLIDFCRTADITDWAFNGARETLNSYKKRGKDVKEDLPWFNSLPFYVETENYYFIHAGLKPNIPIEQQNIYDVLWIREEFINSDYKFDKIVVFGHTPFAKAGLTRSGNIGIDTGCFFTGVLTLFNTTKFELYEIKLPVKPLTGEI